MTISANRVNRDPSQTYIIFFFFLCFPNVISYEQPAVWDGLSGESYSWTFWVLKESHRQNPVGSSSLRRTQYAGHNLHLLFILAVFVGISGVYDRHDEDWLYHNREDRYFSVYISACTVLKVQLCLFCFVYFCRWVHSIQDAESQEALDADILINTQESNLP